MHAHTSVTDLDVHGMEDSRLDDMVEEDLGWIQ